MSFLKLIFKNITRFRTRTLLTVMGITIGIMTIVALSAIAEGLKVSVEKTLAAGGADMHIYEKGAADAFLSTLDESYIEKLKKEDGIKEVDPQLWEVARTPKNPFLFVIGADSRGFFARSLAILEGKLPDAGKSEIAIGKIAVQNEDLKIGSKVTIQRKELTVVGIYESGNIFEDAAVLVPLKDLQKLYKKEEKVTALLIKLKTGMDAKQIGRNIEKRYGDLATITEVAEYAKVDQGMQIIDAAAWAISLLSIIVGGIGVMNTMIMSVFERTREIGVLRAVGWKRRRITAMILLESLVVSFLGAILGIIAGILGASYISSLPGAQAFIDPVFNIVLFERAFMVAIFVGVLGGIFPAIRASRLSPLEALRYE